jgi:transaldolase
MNQLDALKKVTTVVADSGDIESIRHFEPQDATTNPSLILKAADLPQYQNLIKDAVAYARKQGGSKDRIYDWYKAKEPNAAYDVEKDPGVKSVREIYEYYKAHDYKTVIMGASFRKVEQILALAGCDRLTISPNLLEELKASSAPVERKLQPSSQGSKKPAPLTQAEFLWEHHQDAMAVEKLAEGIRLFAVDQKKLEDMLSAQL